MFFNIDKAIKNKGKEREKQIIVTEGYFDVIRLHENGIKTAVATLGTAFSVSHAQILWDICDNFILMFDSDNAGIDAMYRSAIAAFSKISEGKSMEVIILPGGLDPDDFLLANRDVNAIFEYKKSLTDFLWFYYTQKYDLNLEIECGKLLSHMKSDLSNIKSYDLQMIYKKFLMQKFNNVLWQKQHKRYKKKKKQDIRILKSDMTKAMEMKILYMSIILICLKNPEFVVSYSEELLGICMEDCYGKIMENIVYKVTNDPEICSDNLISQMKDDKIVADITGGGFESMYCMAVKRGKIIKWRF